MFAAKAKIGARRRRARLPSVFYFAIHFIKIIHAFYPLWRDAMKTKFSPFLLSLLIALPFPARAQLLRLPIKHVQVRPGLETYNSFLANRLLKTQNPGPGSGEKPFRRLEWYLEPRLQADGSYPAGARWNAYLEVVANRNLAASAIAAANWTAMGPNNIAGRMLDFAFDPNNANMIWAGAASGGIWRSANGGSTWTPMDDQLPTLAVGCVATHPANSNIIYIGTGEGNFNIDAVEGAGVLKSTDGGATWTQTGLSFLLSQGEAVNELVIDPGNPNVLIAATRDGIYRTADAGATWTRTLGTSSGWDGKEVVMSPSNANLVYVALGYPWGNANNGIYKSIDNGVTWTKLAAGLPVSTSMGRVSLAISASSPNTLYAGIANTIGNGSSLLGIYRTTDGGSNWTLQSNSPNHYNGQGWYNNVIAVDPANASIVYSGGVNIYKSTNAGVSWSTITNGIHVDFHAIAFNMGSDFNNASRAMGGTQDNGTNEYSGSTTWTKRLGGDGGEVIFDYSNSNIIYGEYQNGSHQKSTNGGVNWFSINTGVPSGPWVTPVKMDPVNPSVLYTIGSGNLYKTNNGGASWSPLFDATETLDKDIQVAPGDNQRIYVAGAGAIYMSTNGGASFTKISTGLAAASITAMAAPPGQPQALYVTNGGWSAPSHVYKTANGGASWQNVTNNLPNVPCNTIVIDPAHPEIVYAGTDLGVYASLDEGATWSEWNAGLPNVVIDELDIQAAARIIRAATHGRGMYQANMIEPNPGPPAISINDATVAEGNVTPGGMNATFTVTLSAASGQTVTVNYATANGTATAGSDYAAGSGTLTFTAGMTAQTFSVAVKGDVLDETNETFFVNLSAATNATIADHQGRGTINNDDAPPANLALNKPAAALSTYNTTTPGNAADGATTTFWRSDGVNRGSIMWWRVDLGASYSINRVVVKWRSTYYAVKYQIQVSADDIGYSTVFTDNAGNGGTDNVAFSAISARYVRVYMTRNNRGSERLNEVEVYAAPSAAFIATAANETAAAMIPGAVALAQNYPNPFGRSPFPASGTTTLSYSLPAGMNATLHIVNLNGQIVATLANGYHEAGVYQARFDASSLPSGLYFSILKAGVVTQVRRMVLVR
jgi:hypothetical protein